MRLSLPVQTLPALVLAWILVVAAASAQEDVIPQYPFQEGDSISIEQLDKIKNYVPEPFWEHRDFFFYEGMNLRIGKFHADYGPSQARKEANQLTAGKARLGPENSLENYTVGDPFHEIDPNDPGAGTKIAWNLVYHHHAM